MIEMTVRLVMDRQGGAEPLHFNKVVWLPAVPRKEDWLFIAGEDPADQLGITVESVEFNTQTRGVELTVEFGVTADDDEEEETDFVRRLGFTPVVLEAEV